MTSRIRFERTGVESLLRLGDTAWVLSGFALAAQITAAYDSRGFYLATGLGILLVSLFGEVTGLYRSWRGVALHRELGAALSTWAYSVAALMAIGFLTRFTADIPRSALLAGALLTATLFVASRIGLRVVQRALRMQGYNLRTYAIVGVTELGIRLARNLASAPELGLKSLGYFDDRVRDRMANLPLDVGPHVGNLQELIQLARYGKVDRIYITLPMRAENRTRDLLQRLADTTASVYIVPDFFVFELLHSRWSDVGGLPVVSVFENPFYGVDGLVKRLFDIALASALLSILALPMLAIGLLVRLTSPGPVFFRQRRYGLDGREILVWKFRSMTVCENGSDFRQVTRQDPRVTPFGAFLRRTSLDELPQLFNVLDGSMSLVGPRPHATAQNEHFRRLIPGYMLRHKVKPGITGLAQVSGCRGETETVDKMARRIQCDHQYIREWSLWMDLRILFRTLRVVWSKENAY